MSKRRKDALSRREFLGGALAAATVTIVPSFVLGGEHGIPPSERLRIAKVACGGMGAGDLDRVASLGCDIVGLCDVDDNRIAKAVGKFPKAKAYRDYRRMLDEMDKSIDAVVVSTPDHTHAVASMAAMRMGKHVYCQKPLTRTVREARVLKEAAAKYGVVTQMGNQGHGGEGLRVSAEYIRAGAIGTVREVHVWTDRAGRWWPQGMSRPAGGKTPPENLGWDVWLGPAPERPYADGYHPFRWRGWCDFGTGALGDMGCHNIDPAFYALELGPPESVRATCSEFNRESFPSWSIVEWAFPAKGERPAVKVFWYDGGKKPPRPEELEEGRELRGNGILFVGDKGKMLGGSHAGACRIIPESRMKEFPRPAKTLARSIGHYKEWVEAAKGQDITPGSNFDYSGPLTEAVLLGNVAAYFPGETLKWDAGNLRIPNRPEADQYLHYEYRKGWTL
jgi:predicted dehydrogenase